MRKKILIPSFSSKTRPSSAVSIELIFSERKQVSKFHFEIFEFQQGRCSIEKEKKIEHRSWIFDFPPSPPPQIFFCEKKFLHWLKTFLQLTGQENTISHLYHLHVPHAARAKKPSKRREQLFFSTFYFTLLDFDEGQKREMISFSKKCFFRSTSSSENTILFRCPFERRRMKKSFFNSAICRRRKAHLVIWKMERIW